MEEKYLICEDSLEGIFTGIYEAYALREPHERLHIQVGEEENLRLFAVYIRIIPDRIKAEKVAATLNRRLGTEIYWELCKALSTEDGEKGEAVYKTIVRGLKMKNPAQVMGNLTNGYVHKAFELSRRAGNEIHRWQEFLRFQELEGGILFSKIGPKCDVLTFLAPHFADRLPLYNFIIYDEKRKSCVVHPASKEWYMVRNVEISEERMKNYAEGEHGYQELFAYFCHKIAIKERENPVLQRNLLPLRFQDYMVEFWE